MEIYYIYIYIYICLYVVLSDLVYLLKVRISPLFLKHQTDCTTSETFPSFIQNMNWIVEHSTNFPLVPTRSTGSGTFHTCLTWIWFRLWHIPAVLKHLNGSDTFHWFWYIPRTRSDCVSRCLSDGTEYFILCKPGISLPSTSCVVLTNHGSGVGGDP